MELLTVAPHNRAHPFRFTPDDFEAVAVPDVPDVPESDGKTWLSRRRLLSDPTRLWTERRVFSWGRFALVTGRYPEPLATALERKVEEKAGGRWSMSRLSPTEVEGMFVTPERAARLLDEVGTIDVGKAPPLPTVEVPGALAASGLPVIGSGGDPPERHFLSTLPTLEGVWWRGAVSFRPLLEDLPGFQTDVTAPDEPPPLCRVDLSRTHYYTLYSDPVQDRTVTLYRLPPAESGRDPVPAGTKHYYPWGRVEWFFPHGPFFRGMVCGGALVTPLSDGDARRLLREARVGGEPRKHWGTQEERAWLYAAAPLETEWPPDDGWHFDRPELVAFRGVSFRLPPAQRVILEKLVAT